MTGIMSSDFHFLVGSKHGCLVGSIFASQAVVSQLILMSGAFFRGKIISLFH